MHHILAAFAAYSVAGLALAGGDFNPPSWRGGPNSTTQGWTFAVGAAIAGSIPNSDLVPTRNPNFLPPNQFLFPVTDGPQIMAVYRQQVNFSSAFMTLLPNPFGEDPARVLFAIPNYVVADTKMLMRIQLVYRGALPGLDFRAFTGFQEENFAIQAFSNPIDVQDPDRADWRRFSFDVEFGQSTQWQMVTLFNNSIFLSDIESVVIDTIVPAPSAIAVIGLGLLGAGRRRRG